MKNKYYTYRREREDCYSSIDHIYGFLQEFAHESIEADEKNHTTFKQLIETIEHDLEDQMQVTLILSTIYAIGSNIEEIISQLTRLRDCGVLVIDSSVDEMWYIFDNESHQDNETYLNIIIDTLISLSKEQKRIRVGNQGVHSDQYL